MGPVVLAKNFTVVVEDNNQAFVGDWIGVDAEFQNWNLHVHVQTITSTAAATGLEIKVMSSYDMVEEYQVGSAIQANNTGSQNTAISSIMGDKVRLVIGSAEASNVMMATLSVWLQPKAE